MSIRVIYSFTLILIMTMILTGCTSNRDNSSKEDIVNLGDTGSAAIILTTSQILVNNEFTANDLDVGYENSTATQIVLKGSTVEVSGAGAAFYEGVLTIKNKGTYVISGNMEDGQIVVDAGDNEKVHIILKGVSINCSSSAPIYIKNADKIFITLEEGFENTLTDGVEYTQTDDNNLDGVIFSTSDLTINGDGVLNITGNYKHGIVSKDDLIITGGTYHITAIKDTINGKDCVKIKTGIFNLSAATGNGIQSKNSDDATRGYVYIEGGEITITQCKEGIEGTAIIIAGGKINITAEDDGINAARKTNNVAQNDMLHKATNEADTNRTGRPGMGEFGGGSGNAFEADANCYISISGGEIVIDAMGDGIDSNGSLVISGGHITVHGPTDNRNGALDYNATADITGGTVLVAGSAGMAQGFSDSSSQYSILYNLTTLCESGTEVKLTDGEGNVVVSYIPNKEFQSVVLSAPELTKDETYTLTCGNQTASITLSSVVTSNGLQGIGGQRGGGGWKSQPRPAN